MVLLLDLQGLGGGGGGGGCRLWRLGGGGGGGGRRGGGGGGAAAVLVALKRMLRPSCSSACLRHVLPHCLSLLYLPFGFEGLSSACRLCEILGSVYCAGSKACSAVCRNPTAQGLVATKVCLLLRGKSCKQTQEHTNVTEVFMRLKSEASCVLTRRFCRQ